MGEQFYFWFLSRVLLENGGFALGVRAWREVALVNGSVKVCDTTAFRDEAEIETSY